jgi:hypothetical protein
MVLQPLTPEEQARHHRGIERIRRQLFRKYSPAEYFIVPDSEKVLNASAEGCWNAACGNYRVFRFGGLRYHVDCAEEGGLSKVSLTHDEQDRFTFWLGSARGYTINCFHVRFSELDERMYAYVLSFRRANLSPVYSQRPRKR